MPRYRLLDTAGSEIEIVEDDRPAIREGELVALPPSGRPVEVLDVYDDEHGRDGGVVATLVVEED
jgi:hypothetical protein